MLSSKHIRIAYKNFIVYKIHFYIVFLNAFVEVDQLFTLVSEKPSDFEPDICKAVEEGKLSSVQNRLLFFS